jgi:pilus assembly protein CpaE
MEYAVVCETPSIYERLQASLQQLSPDCAKPRVISPQRALQFISELRAASRHAAIFFGSMEFSPDDQQLLRRICEAGNEHIRVVAVGPTFGPDIILQTIRNGAVDYLDITSQFNRELENLIERLNASSADRPQLGRMFTVVSAVGGSGASTLALNLAAAIAARHAQCGLLDFQLRGGHLASLLQLTPRHTVVSIAEKVQQLDRAMFDQAFVVHPSGIRLLAGPAQFSDLRHFSGQVIQRIIALSRSSLSHVVVDLEDCLHAEQVRAAANSERLVIPFRLDYVSLLRTKELVDFLLGAQFTQSQIVLVASRCGQAKELPLGSIEDLLGVPIDHKIPNDPAAVNTSCNLGEPYVLASPRSPAALAVLRLSEHLLGEAHSTVHAMSRVSALWAQFPAMNPVHKLVQSVRSRRTIPLPEGGDA